MNNRIYELVKTIPKGKVSSYKLIAETLGINSYRSIGKSLNKNYDNSIPCHRVIYNNGLISGYNNGIRLKKQKLIQEGINIKNNKINKKFFFQFK